MSPLPLQTIYSGSQFLLPEFLCLISSYIHTVWSSLKFPVVLTSFVIFTRVLILSTYVVELFFFSLMWVNQLLQPSIFLFAHTVSLRPLEKTLHNHLNHFFSLHCKHCKPCVPLAKDVKMQAVCAQKKQASTLKSVPIEKSTFAELWYKRTGRLWVKYGQIQLVVFFLFIGKSRLQTYISFFSLCGSLSRKRYSHIFRNPHKLPCDTP